MDPYWNQYFFMPNLSIKNVPESVVARLREQARSNHRSLQGELMALVTEAVGDSGSRQRPVSVSPSGPTDRVSLETIAAEHQARRSDPVDQGPSSADIIRAERDAR